MNQLIISILFGFLFVIIGFVSKLILKPFLKVVLPEICEKWNENRLMEVTLFLTGVLFSLLLSTHIINEKVNPYLLALTFGLVVIGLSEVARMITYPLLKVNLPEICNTWNDKHIKEVSRFLTGAAFSVIYLYIQPHL